jgi:creatinine amidohydrolase
MRKTSSTPPITELAPARARELLATGAPVWLGVNPVEYHGPHLSPHNDVLISAGLVRDMHARLAERHPEWPLLDAGELELGLGAVAGPGTRPEPAFGELVRRIDDACRPLERLGARRIVLATFHGSPLHNLAIEDALCALERRGVTAVAPMFLLFRRFVQPIAEELDEAVKAVTDPEVRALVRRELPRDFHAGFLETSLSLHYAPATVHEHRAVPPCPPYEPLAAPLALAKVVRRLGREQLAGELELIAWGLGWTAVRPFPGYTGRPALAEAKVGRRMAELVADAGAQAVLDVFDGRAPRPKPVLPWLAAATFRGRLPTGAH